MDSLNTLVPPDSLIVENGIGIGMVGNIRKDFCAIGEGIIGNMVRQGFIRPDYTLLDVGCGLGRLARPLVKILNDRGSYTGLDVTRSSIEWCRQAYSAYQRFTFHHIDVFNMHYNPRGVVRAHEYHFKLANNTFDFAWSTSLFTHMLILDVDHYLVEMARVLKPGGRCWNTFLLLDDISGPLVRPLEGRRSLVSLPHPIEGGLTHDLADPEEQIAFYLDRVRAAYTAAGLEIEDIRFGPWSGRADNIRAGRQDVIIGRKPEGGPLFGSSVPSSSSNKTMSGPPNAAASPT